jgi:GT2 family glycosyltransferase
MNPSSPQLTVVIPNHRAPELLVRCVRSVLAARAASAAAAAIEVIVVDDGSSDGTPELLATRFPEVRVVALPENRGYPAAVNAGVAAAGAPWVLTLNNDTTVDPGLFDALLRAASAAPDVGLLAAQQRFSARPDTLYSAGIVVDRAIQVSDRRIGEPVTASERELTEVFGACGAAALYRRSMLEALGGFDERFRFGLEDADLAWRARAAGWRCLYAPDAVVFHDLGGTVPHGSRRRLYQAGRNRWLLIAKHLARRQLLAHLPQIILFDLAYVLYACPRHRTLAPLRGRIDGLSMWRELRRGGADGRVTVPLTGRGPLRAALRRRRLWRTGAVPAEPSAGGARRILLLNQYAPPDRASTGRMAGQIAAALVDTGRAEAILLAGQPSYGPGLPAAPGRERRDGVEVIRLPLPRRGGRLRMTGRLASYAGYGVGALTAGAWLARRRGVDTVVAFHNPPLLPLIGRLIAGHRRLIAVVMDVHPDVVIASGTRLPGPLVRAWDRLGRWSLRGADEVIVLSEGMRTVLVGKGIAPARIDVIPVWAQPELDPVERPAAAPGEFTIFLGGNVGMAQGADGIVALAEALRGDSVRFVVVSTGTAAADLLRRADAAVVSLKPGTEHLLVPSRAFPPLSAGVPLLALMEPDSELGSIITRFGAGAVSRDPARLAQAVRTWIADPAEHGRARAAAAAAYRAGGGRAGSLRRYVEVIIG